VGGLTFTVFLLQFIVSWVPKSGHVCDKEHSSKTRECDDSTSGFQARAVPKVPNRLHILSSVAWKWDSFDVLINTTPVVRKISKNLIVTSKLKASEGWHEASSILTTHIY
jgi:hypothetical protein